MNNLKQALILLTVIILSGCAGAHKVPTDTQSINKEISIKRDDFKKHTTILSGSYLLNTNAVEDGETYPYLTFQATYRDNGDKYLLINMKIIDYDWLFINTAIDENGTNLSVTNKQSDTSIVAKGSIASTVFIEEKFSLKLTKKYLEMMANKTSDFKIKLYGTKRNTAIQVPSRLTNAFLQKLNCFETATCT